MFFLYSTIIDDFRVSDAISFGGANSGQTCIKRRDLACNVEPSPLKNCKDLAMKLEVKYLFPTSSSGANFYIYQVPEGLEMRKILAHGIRMQKNPRTMEDICKSKVQLAPQQGNFISGVANPEIVC